MNAQILEQTVATKKLYVTTLKGLTRVAVLMDTRVMVKAVQVNICIHPQSVALQLFRPRLFKRWIALSTG